MIENKLVLMAISLVTGIVLKTIVDKILNKTKIIYFTNNTERVAVSNNDPIYGNIKVEWEGHSVQNLYNSVITIENTTSVDYEDLEIKIWSGQDTVILNEKTGLEGTTRIIEWSDEFKNELSISEGNEELTKQQLNTYNHERRYKLPVFNREQKLQFSYLSSLVNTNSTHGIWVELIYPGLKFEQRFATNKIHDVLVSDALFWGLLSSIVAVILSTLYLENVWLIASISMVTGLFAQSIGAYIYKFITSINNLITK